jgi:transposase
VEVFEAIRRDRRVSGMSIRALAERHGVHRRTVRQALDSAAPLPRKVPVRRSARLESLKALIDEMLVADLDAPRKQRHTARRVAVRLADEHGVTGVSYSTVRDYVARRRESGPWSGVGSRLTGFRCPFRRVPWLDVCCRVGRASACVRPAGRAISWGAGGWERVR